MKIKQPGGKSLEDFRRAHDPRFEGDSPVPVFDWSLPRGAKRLIITSAQNATPVHDDFWAILAHMERTLDAPRVAIPIRYKNPTSAWSGSQKGAEYWDQAVRPFLCNVHAPLNDNLTLMGDIKIQPTASSPLTGAEGLSLASSGIIGHPKIHTRSVPTPQNKMAKLLMTTGSCTVENYTDSRAGRLGHFHHSISALLVEIKGKRFHIRRLHYDAKTKSVTDLGKRYFADRTEKAPPALALVMGDTHVDYIDPAVERATFGPGGLVETINPQHLVWHDLLDGYSCNPHHAGNPFNKIAKRDAGADDVRAEVERAIEFVRARTVGRKSVIVPSNHDDFLRRWILSTDWRTDPVNADFYLETALAMRRGTKLGTGGTETPDPFRYWFEKAKVPNAICLDGSFVLADVELGFHFDRGPNGSRGSIKNMRRIGVKTIGGHSHSPGEDEGATQTGTSTRLRLEYNGGGPSSWLNAHVALNADGKRQLIVLVDGECCL